MSKRNKRRNKSQNKKGFRRENGRTPRNKVQTLKERDDRSR